ncbi:hypothetical protein [Streptomyces sp. ME19-01-6]|uniref:hypothetical protein n=1 Tax=Streptomyces sp. ME19-01-6 TaxID=3028686 RepID=UPI0029A26315|nr:hypothetical protein [Streptomyces sp. ME19-01-6]MDX3232963.1 hypothetical protein [Streptomyces sp. ME19-01-6]
MGQEQLVLDIAAAPLVPASGPRMYWENHGPRDWRPVTVRVRYGETAGMPAPVFPLVRTATLAPRNVLVERGDGTAAVRPVRLLRCRPPRPRLSRVRRHFTQFRRPDPLSGK